jgi:hypothetical protein
VIGACVVSLLTDSIDAQMKRIKLGASGYFGAIDRGGVMVFHPSADMVLSFNMLQEIELKHVAEAALSGKRRLISIMPYKGRIKALAYATVPSTGGLFWRQMPESEFLATATINP